MGVIDEVIRANEAYAAQFKLGNLAVPPARKLAVVACMDARLDVELLLGLKPGDAHIIRNAGGIVTDDALRSLLISRHLLGTQEFMIINHTGCGMLTFKEQDFAERLRRETGSSAVTPAIFHAFTDLDANVRDQVQKLRAHPWVPRQIPIRGFVYDVKTGSLREVTTAQTTVHGA